MAQVILTEKQKDLIRWIVKEVRADNLPEAAIRFTFAQDRHDIENYAGDEGNIPLSLISRRVLDMFHQLKFMHNRGTTSRGVTTSVQPSETGSRKNTVS